MGDDLQIAEVPYPSGSLRCRYARYLSDDGKRWIRHGLFSAYYENGARKSEGAYKHGLEQGEWRDFHPNGVLAAEGRYEDGVEVGVWRFWNDSGAAEADINYDEAAGPSRPARDHEDR